MINSSKKVVTTMAYLTGVSNEKLITIYAAFENDLLTSLHGNKSASLIRTLSIMRTKLVKKFKSFTPAIFTEQGLKILHESDIDIPNGISAHHCFILLNRAIYAHINECRGLFPTDTDWDKIYNLFVVKGCIRNVGSARDIIEQEIKKYNTNYLHYPFQRYIHWDSIECGNLFDNDRKFFAVIKAEYKNEKETKPDTNSDGVLRMFLDKSQMTIIAVDCENTDSYKLMSMLKGLTDTAGNKISKVMLFTDEHIPVEWQAFNEMCPYLTEVYPSKRILDHKSTVDIVLASEISREHYSTGARSFIIVSSDSDFLSVMSSLHTASFLMLTEDEQCSKNTLDALDKMNVPHCSLDDFPVGDVQDFKMTVLLRCLKSKIEKFNKSGVLAVLNYVELMNTITEQCRITLSADERRSFINRYLLTLKLVIGNDDNFCVEISA